MRRCRCRWAPVGSPATGCPTTRPNRANSRNCAKYVRAQVADVASRLTRFGQPELSVATSKTLRQLARIAGAPASSEGLYAKRT